MAQDNYYGNPYVDGQDDFWKEPSGDPQQAAKQESGGYTAPSTPSGGYDLEGFRKRWMQSGDVNNVEAWLGANQDITRGVTIKNGQHAYDPNGRYIADLIMNKNTGQPMSRGFLDGIGSNGKPRTATTASRTSAAPAPVVSQYDRQAAEQAAQAQALALEVQRKKEQDEALRQQLIDQLTQRAQQGLKIDRNTDPNIRVQADAYAANEERARRNYLADIAEKAGPLANLRGEQRLAAERVGQRTGSFEAELIGRELTARRTEIQDALTQMGGLLTTGQEMSLRKELALMDDAIKRLQIQNQSTQFGQNLAEQARQFNAELGYKNKALAEQSKQAANQLGFNYDSFDWIRSPLNPANMPRE